MNSSGLGCVSVPPAQVSVPPSPKHTTLAPSQVLYCSICSARSILTAYILLIYELENQNQIKSFIILAVIRQSLLRVGGSPSPRHFACRQHSSFPKNVAAVESGWQHYVRFDKVMSSLFYHTLKSKQEGNSDKTMRSSGQLHLLAILNSYRHKLKLVIEHKTENIINNVTGNNDRPKIWTSDFPLQRQMRCRLTNWPRFANHDNACEITTLLLAGTNCD